MGQSGRITRTAEPRFDIDLAYGRQAELQFQELLQWLAEGNGRAEVKRKSIVDWWFYVETHCDRGRTGIFEPSGISTTAAHVWAIYIADTGISLQVPTDALRLMLGDTTSRDKTETDGNCPTRGKLVNLVTLLYRYHQHLSRAGAPVPPSKPLIERKTVSLVTDDQIPWGR